MDLAWSSNGYVYHTRLDTAARVSPAALQRTGDNVLALLQGAHRAAHCTAHLNNLQITDIKENAQCLLS